VRAALAAAGLVAVACGPGAGQGTRVPGPDWARPGVELTLRHGGRGGDDAIVVERRLLDLRAGEQSIELTDLGAQVSQLSLRSLAAGDPAGDELVVLEQRVLPGLQARPPGPPHVGDWIAVRSGGKTIVGRVVSLFADEIVVENDAGVHKLPLDAIDGLPLLDLGMRAALAPRVQLRVRAARPGRQLVELAYTLGGVSWRAEHRMTLASAAPAGDVEVATWIVVDDASGRGFRDAQVTLVEARDSGQAHRSYPLATPLTIAHGTQLRVPLGATAHLTARRVTRFDGSGGLLAPQTQELEPYFGTAPAPARSTDELRLAAAGHLPAGRAQLYQPTGAGGPPLLVADSRLEVDPDAGLATVPLGPGYGLSGQRRRLGLDWGERRLVERFEIVVRNDVDVAREVQVFELLYRTPRWRIVDESVRHVVAGARSVEFPLTVAARQRGRVRYAVEYTW